ncbi:Uncharacterized protein FWK35_00030787 [Aphis craccivora]|uniref:MULE domain-containing protein n=1 Tax=Aphis craccivora TaxID=307492 RepID=A0A6G0VU10_APHCR|nr:Uncharacterized protein FWK35_00030787 [Aphis craccivora]
MSYYAKNSTGEVSGSTSKWSSIKKEEIPDSYKVYSLSEGISENYFLLDDSGPSENIILIFGRPRSLEILHFSKVWYCDGTLKVAQIIFAQVYVILAEVLNGVHPLIYALLPNKQEKTYDKLFDMLNLLIPGFSVIYKNDADFLIFIKIVVALSLVPIENLDATIQQLGDDLPEYLQPLFDWFEDNYVGRVNRNGRGRRTA